jgi:hypothetical protein
MADANTAVIVLACVQGAATLILAAITYSYARTTARTSEATRRQADASVEMAREMRHTRYDAVRPVLDIQPEPEVGVHLIARAVAGEEGDPKRDLQAGIRNVGLGPALKVDYSLWLGEKCVRKQHGVLGCGHVLGPHPLAVERSQAEPASWSVMVRYQDVFGRQFHSRLAIGEDGFPLTVEVGGPLESRDSCGQEGIL